MNHVERTNTGHYWTPAVHGGARHSTGAPAPHISTTGESRPEVIARLERLDDLVFAAIDGDPNALDLVADAWRSALDDLGRETVEESRRQYLRHAKDTWAFLRQQPDQSPHKVFAAIEVISILSHRAG